jgi:hypothetical protein
MIAHFNERFYSLLSKMGEIAGTLKFLSRTFVSDIIAALVVWLVSCGLKMIP